MSHNKKAENMLYAFITVIVGKILGFFLITPLRIYKHFTKRGRYYPEIEAKRIALIYTIISFIFWFAFFLLVLRKFSVWVLVIPMLLSVATYDSGYKYLQWGDDAFDEKTDVLCQNCKSLFPRETTKCNVCGARIDNKV